MIFLGKTANSQGKHAKIGKNTKIMIFPKEITLFFAKCRNSRFSLSAEFGKKIDNDDDEEEEDEEEEEEEEEEEAEEEEEQ